jgi:hypothetical protein
MDLPSENTIEDEVSQLLEDADAQQRSPETEIKKVTFVDTAQAADAAPSPEPEEKDTPKRELNFKDFM